MKNVSKLDVNEAKISQIYNYKDQKSFMNLMSFDKKALVVVNADVQIMYDLSKLEYTVDEANKTLKITYIRSEEHTSELQSRPHLVCRLLLEKKKKKKIKKTNMKKY